MFILKIKLYSCIFPINKGDLKVLFTFNPLMITIFVKWLLHSSRATLLRIIRRLVPGLWLLFVKELLLKINNSGSTEKKILSNWHNIIYIKSRQCAIIIWSNKPIWTIEASFKIYTWNINKIIFWIWKKDLMLLCNSLDFLNYWYNPLFSSSFYSSFMELMSFFYAVSNC